MSRPAFSRDKHTSVPRTPPDRNREQFMNPSASADEAYIATHGLPIQTDPTTPTTNPSRHKFYNNHEPSAPINRSNSYEPTYHPAGLDNNLPALYNDTIPPDSPLHFSPSKARAAAQATQQLAILRRWLNHLLPNQPSLLSKWTAEHKHLTTGDPALAASMQAWLQEVMARNRTADQRARLLFDAKTAELATQAPMTMDETALLRELYGALTGEARGSLASLSETSVGLGEVPDMAEEEPLERTLGRAVLEYTLRTQDLQGLVDEVQRLQRMLDRQVDAAKSELDAFETERDSAVKQAEVMRPQTLQWNREVKQISLKVREYQDRVAALERSRPDFESGVVRVEDVVEVQERVRQRREVIKDLEERLGVLHGLPPDLQASRDEVKRAKVELEGLKARREELFAIMATK